MVLRLIVSPTRSGSTALLRCFENHSQVELVLHQPVKSGFRQDRSFDYSWYEDGDWMKSRDTYVAKETVGGFELREATFPPLPSDEAAGFPMPSAAIVEAARPVILLRDPLQTWGSIERLNQFSRDISPYQSPIDLLIESYVRVVSLAEQMRAANQPVLCVTQERIGVAPQAELFRICQHWGLTWQSALTEWPLPYGVKTWFSEETLRRFESDPRFKKSKEAMLASSGYDYRPAPTSFLSEEDVSIVEGRLRPHYNRFLALCDSAGA